MGNFTDQETYDIRYTTQNDASFLKEVLMKEEVCYWFPMGSETSVDLMVRNWVGFSKYNSAITALDNGRPCAMAALFLMPYKKVAHMAMGQIVVEPGYQRRGVGTSLVRNLGHLAKTKFSLETLYFEVYGGCPLIPILSKLNYYKVFEQGHFAKVGDTYLSRIVYEVKL